MLILIRPISCQNAYTVMYNKRHSLLLTQFLKKILHLASNTYSYMHLRSVNVASLSGLKSSVTS